MWTGSGLALLAAGLLMAQLVWAAPPSANFTISDSTLDTGQSVTFSSTSSDPDADIATLEWDFDYDGSFNADATGESVSHTYDTPGARSVALRVTDTAGDPNGGDGTVDQALSVKAVSVSTPNQVATPNHNPVASAITFTHGPPNGDMPYVGRTIAISGAGSDPDFGDTIASYEWDFGDGDTAIGKHVSHAYSTRGTKTVTLRVRDNHGALSAPLTQSVTINALLRPLFPLEDVQVGIKGRLHGSLTVVTRLRVRAPRKALVKVSCRGRHCPKARRKRSSGRRMHFRAVERTFRPGVKIAVTVRRKGFLARRTTFKMKAHAEPVRRDGCVAPGAKRTRRCPST